MVFTSEHPFTVLGVWGLSLKKYSNKQSLQLLRSNKVIHPWHDFMSLATWNYVYEIRANRFALSSATV